MVHWLSRQVVKGDSGLMTMTPVGAQARIPRDFLWAPSVGP